MVRLRRRGRAPPPFGSFARATRAASPAPPPSSPFTRALTAPRVPPPPPLAGALAGYLELLQ